MPTTYVRVTMGVRSYDSNGDSAVPARPAPNRKQNDRRVIPRWAD
jgi:hypothetical protein